MRARPVPLLAVLLVGVLLAGCRLDLATDVVIDADGGADVEVVLRADPALAAELDAIGVDPTAELAAVADPGGWEPQRGVDEDGALVVVLRRELDDVSGLGTALSELTAGLAATDPGPRWQLSVERDERGRLSVTGTATMVAPGRAAAELDGEPLGPSAAELAALTGEHVRTVLTVTVPGEVIDHDGDLLEGRTVTWEVPVDRERTVTLVAEPAGWLTRWREQLGDPVLVAGGAALAVLLVGGVAAGLRRRR